MIIVPVVYEAFDKIIKKVTGNKRPENIEAMMEEPFTGEIMDEEYEALDYQQYK